MLVKIGSFPLLDQGKISKKYLKSPPTLPGTNIFAPENGWLEYDRFLFGFCLFSGAKLLIVSGRVIFNSTHLEPNLKVKICTKLSPSFPVPSKWLIFHGLLVYYYFEPAISNRSFFPHTSGCQKGASLTRQCHCIDPWAARPPWRGAVPCYWGIPVVDYWAWPL